MKRETKVVDLFFTFAQYDTLNDTRPLRPVLKFAKYDTLNYKTPLKYYYRVSYLANLRIGLKDS